MTILKTKRLILRLPNEADSVKFQAFDDRNMKHMSPWRSAEVQNFSVVALLVPSIMGSATALFGLQFLDIPEGFIRPPLLADLWDIRNPLVPIRGIWDRWEILVFVTSYTRTILSPIPSPIGSSFRLPDYSDLKLNWQNLLRRLCSIFFVFARALPFGNGRSLQNKKSAQPPCIFLPI